MKLTIGETAKLLGYNRSYFSTRRNQFDDFGPPSEEIGGKTKFDHEEVIKWAGENGVKIDQEALKKLLFAYGEKLRDDAPNTFVPLEGDSGARNIRDEEIRRLFETVEQEQHHVNRMFSVIFSDLAKLDKRISD